MQRRSLSTAGAVLLCATAASCGSDEDPFATGGAASLSDGTTSAGNSDALDESSGGAPKPDPTDEGGDDGGQPGSCEGVCGESAPHLGGTCYCDPSCGLADDCCPDYEAACGGQCALNEHCADDEVCTSSTQECVEASLQTYDLTVVEWTDYTPNCWDALSGDCLADVFYEVRYGGELIFSSDVVDETVSASWDEPVVIALQPDDALVVRFYDWDAVTANDFTNSVCFTNPDGECGPVPTESLHAGGAVWDTEDFYVWLQLRPR
jgi:hypothetical protein